MSAHKRKQPAAMNGPVLNSKNRYKKPTLKKPDPNTVDLQAVLEDEQTRTVIVQLTPSGAQSGDDDAKTADTTASPQLPQLEVPIGTTKEQLTVLVNKLLNNDEARPYTFFFQEEELGGTIKAALQKEQVSTEEVVSIVYQPEAVFRVRVVTRCTSSLPGHEEAVLHVHFSPDGQHLASGSGDATVRIWDVDTETPKFVLRGHTHWVMAVAWAPTGHILASGSMDKTVRLWNPRTGKRLGRILKGHKQTITSLCWEPLHTITLSATSASSSSSSSDPGAELWSGLQGIRLASGSKDGTVRIWDTVRGSCVCTVSGHTSGVTCVQWGGQGLLYTASKDRTIHVWDVSGRQPNTMGKLVRVLQGHAHWINSMSLSTAHALRTGPFDHTSTMPTSAASAIETAQKRYKEALSACGGKELLVSGSDDFTLFLWEPSKGKKPITRMTGHQQPVNWVSFSPDGRHIASASFDNSVRLWDGETGKFICTFRGHVNSVYQVCWSSDSRMLVTSSKDSTLKLWDIRKKKLKEDLPGHADEVFACDWSPDGQRVASGGKDKLLRIWRH